MGKRNPWTWKKPLAWRCVDFPFIPRVTQHCVSLGIFHDFRKSRSGNAFALGCNALVHPLFVQVRFFGGVFIGVIDRQRSAKVLPWLKCG